MGYGKALGWGLALIALAYLDNKVGEKKRNWEEKHKEYEEELDRLNSELNDVVTHTNYDLDYKELIDLHYQSFKTADNTKELLDDARDSLKVIGETIQMLKENRETINSKLSTENDKIEKKKLKDELSSIIETRKMLFSNQDEIKKQRNELSKKLKEFNLNTKKLKFKIRDTGNRGQQWFDKLEERKIRRNRNYSEENNTGGCFLTTACTRHLGLSDDCFELEILRSFRDNYIKTLPEGERLILKYYENAPKILSRISKSNIESLILNEIYTEIDKIVLDIQLGDNEKAIFKYQQLFYKLENKFN